MEIPFSTRNTAVYLFTVDETIQTSVLAICLRNGFNHHVLEIQFLECSLELTMSLEENCQVYEIKYLFRPSRASRVLLRL